MKMRNSLKAGFTLIELLVTLILLGLLTAVVFPVVVQQIDDAEPTKAANDFANIKTGIEVFHLNVRPTWPGDLEDLVHQVDGTFDNDVNANNFSNPNKWNGPYIDAAVALGTVAGTGAQETGDAVTTGYGMAIQNQLVCYNATANTFQPAVGTQSCAAGTDFVALLIDGETTFQAAADNLPTEFTAIDELIDNEAGGWNTGKVRMAQTNGTVFPGTGNVASYIVYLVAPFTN
jgi:prepilin-type N-terminal cleavage/methylation domain-containing protein